MKKQRERFQDILVLSTKKGRIKISVQGGYTAREMYQASEHMLVMAGKRYAREKKNGEGNG